MPLSRQAARVLANDRIGSRRLRFPHGIWCEAFGFSSGRFSGAEDNTPVFLIQEGDARARRSIAEPLHREPREFDVTMTVNAAASRRTSPKSGSSTFLVGSACQLLLGREVQAAQPEEDHRPEAGDAPEAPCSAADRLDDGAEPFQERVCGAPPPPVQDSLPLLPGLGVLATAFISDTLECIIHEQRRPGASAADSLPAHE